MKLPIALPKLKHPDDVRLLWHNAYYDGILSGIIMLEGREHFFECNDPDRCHREYIVYPLTDEEIATERYWHELFCEHVGTHTNYSYNENNLKYRSLNGTVKPREGHHIFYDAAKNRMPQEKYRDNHEPVGVFQLSKCPHFCRARSVRYWNRWNQKET